jgi:hypothetical protein
MKHSTFVAQSERTTGVVKTIRERGVNETELFSKFANLMLDC